MCIGEAIDFTTPVDLCFTSRIIFLFIVCSDFRASLTVEIGLHGTPAFSNFDNQYLEFFWRNLLESNVMRSCLCFNLSLDVTKRASFAISSIPMAKQALSQIESLPTASMKNSSFAL